MHRRELQADQRLLPVGEVADDLPQRARQLLHQRRAGDDLVLLRKARVGHQIDDLYLVLTVQVLFAKALEVGERGERLGRLPRGIEAQFPDLFGLGAEGGGFAHLPARFFSTPPPRRRAAASLCSASASCLNLSWSAKTLACS